MSQHSATATAKPGPAVTVFMPVYNALPYLEEAVESIRRQTLRDWTFLIVDDGSTDGSVEYLEALDDARIRVLRQAHQGPAVAANRALELCETEFVARLDADDVSHPARLQEQLAFLRKHPEVGLLGTQFETLGAARTGRPSSLPTDHRTIMHDLIRGRHAMCNPTIMCRTSLLREVGGYHAEGALEDWAMFLSMGERAELANLDRVLLSYRIHAGSTNNRHMTGLRASIAFVCDRARRRQAGIPPVSRDEFLAERRAGPFWRRALFAMEGYAMTQYRRAMVDILGPWRIRGYLRLAWAAACSPSLTWQRIARVARKHLFDPNGSGKGAVPLVSAFALPSRCSKPAGRGQTDAGTSEPPIAANGAEDPAELVKWPPKYELFGVRLSATDYDEAVEAILGAARRRLPAVASFHAVHALITASEDPELREAVNQFELVGPDGQPVRWALNFLHGVGLRDRVYGPELMLRLCRRAASEGVPIYLYGSTPETIEALRTNLVERCPGLRVAGAESPPFRPLSAEEEDRMIRRINGSGAGILFVGLGAPKQDDFASRHRDRIRAVQVCVGAAFDFHAGTKKTAPSWMQRYGLEWFFRLCSDPRRLWRRYLVTNSIFLGKLAAAAILRFGRPRKAPGGRTAGPRHPLPTSTAETKAPRDVRFLLQHPGYADSQEPTATQ